MDEATEHAALVNRNRVIVRYCVLYWGVPCSFLFAAAMVNSVGEEFWFWLAIGLPIWCLGGYVFGRILLRRMNERLPTR